MKIGLYSPFMQDNVGGGERYLLTVAECLLKKPDIVVDLFVQESDRQKRVVLKDKYSRIFNLDLERLNVISGPFGNHGSLWQRWQVTSKYDAFYYMTDGSFFLSGSKRSILHFMIPFKQPLGGWFNLLKLRLWPIKVANSFFTKFQVEKNWGIKFDFVHWGAVNLDDFKPLKKENIILNVARFFTSSGNKHCKRQDVMVRVFKRLCDTGLKDWQLVLVGTIDNGKDNLEYANQITKMIENYPIKIIHEINFKDLASYYGRAKIYWHATGFNLDEDERPEAMEHLGLSTVEAMAAGAVPVVINKAGQKEIVTEDKDGLLWEAETELIEKTLSVIENQELQLRLAAAAQKRAIVFSKDNFCKKTSEIFGL